MKTVSVTIYCDEGSKGSNRALPQKKLPSGSFYFYKVYCVIGISGIRFLLGGCG